jgi:hypothetical protein
MDDSIHCVNICLKYYLFLIHILIIIILCAFYSIEKVDSNLYRTTNCQINQTLTQEIPCPIRKQTILSSEINQLCKITYYRILYEENLRKNPMIFSGKILSKPINITCYYNRLTHRHIRWTQPDPKRIIQCILFSFISICLMLISCFHGYCCRRSNRR